jgi:hypothetical protein
MYKLPIVQVDEQNTLDSLRVETHKLYLTYQKQQTALNRCAFALGSTLTRAHHLLAKSGRDGQWAEFCRQAEVPLSTADDMRKKYQETLSQIPEIHREAFSNSSLNLFGDKTQDAIKSQLQLINLPTPAGMSQEDYSAFVVSKVEKARKELRLAARKTAVSKRVTKDDLVAALKETTEIAAKLGDEEWNEAWAALEKMAPEEEYGNFYLETAAAMQKHNIVGFLTREKAPIYTLGQEGDVQ